MQVVTLFNLTHLLLHSLNTMSETIFSNSLIFQEFAKLKYTLNLKISKSQNLTNAKISRPKVGFYFQDHLKAVRLLLVGPLLSNIGLVTEAAGKL